MHISEYSGALSFKQIPILETSSLIFISHNGEHAPNRHQLAPPTQHRRRCHCHSNSVYPTMPAHYSHQVVGNGSCWTMKLRLADHSDIGTTCVGASPYLGRA